jgi:hypothetical protein
MIKLLFFFILSANLVVSQTIKKALGLYSTEYNQKEIRGKSNECKVSFNTLTGQLTVEDNLAAIKLDDNRMNPMDPNANGLNLLFNANVGKDISSILKDNKNANLLKIEGTLIINGVSRETVAFWAPIQFDPTSSELLIDFEIKFMSEDYNLADVNFPFTKLVEFEIEDGLMNKIE